MQKKRKDKKAASSNPQIKPAMASEGARPKSQVNVPAKPQQIPERTVSLVWGRQKRDDKKILSLAGEPEVFGTNETEFPPLPDKE